MRGRARMLDAHARGARKLSAYAPMALRSPQRQLDQEAPGEHLDGRSAVAPSLCCRSPLPLLPPAATKTSRRKASTAAPAALAHAKKPLPLPEKGGRESCQPARPRPSDGTSACLGEEKSSVM